MPNVGFWSDHFTARYITLLALYGEMPHNATLYFIINLKGCQVFCVKSVGKSHLTQNIYKIGDMTR